ncbi:MAG: tetraacyldisaccharide 4'-kinase [Nitrosomonadales bacterium]|nr:tetraacyldisaccharide 4'-kinase [Nitrosomonadales bacterium]MBT4571271.1 tetraacyldisaccharide 4'-kinase [Nitrosomonadales bacterium]MBT4759268.1 tetraacyldisaccharide 4'-kinase [Nitrosomonadales bacterium]MBT5150174.1 tetraacyldisaccharide 4'-kinase [Nitrosomonadales bacterium]MBT6014820.1 tetraacyldisaccharide 4'-kinase [Nitrosomonadales bacterium]
MRKLISIDQIFNKQYYIKSNWIYLLIPLGAVFYLINILRTYLYDKGFLKKYKIKVPVIIVGNITLGGTGKTPLALNLITKFINKGLQPALISRGYGGNKKNITEVLETTNVRIVGDEALLIKTKSKIPVFVGKDRVSAAKKLLNKYPETSIIISDDGLQHLKLARDYEIIVIDSKRKFGNGFLFPAGPLRENKTRLGKVDAIVIKGENNNPKFYQMKYITKCLKNLKTGKKIKFKDLQNKNVVAITAIGNPESFFSTLIDNGLEFKKIIFNDHYLFKKSDFVKYEDCNIVMTEKDAIKCKQFATKNFWIIPLETEVDENLFLNILKKVA